MVLTVVGVIIPQPISIASSANTSAMSDQSSNNSNDSGIYVSLTQGSDSHWALLNLILSITGALLAIVMAIRFIAKKRYEDNEEQEENEKEERSRLMMLSAAPILAILAILLFILTQDPTRPMVISDKWILVHAILFISGLLSYVFLMKKEKDEDNNEGEHATADV